MKYIFIINPTAGKGKVQSLFAEKVNEYFKENGGDYEIYYTSVAGDALKHSKKLAESGENLRIYACGGEGTAFEVLNGIYGYDNVSLGVVPCGSANDYVSYFSHKEIFLDVPALVDGEEIEVDIIKSGDKYALNSCSMGMDAMVASHMSKFKKWPLVSGKMAYVLALLYTFFSKMGVNLKITIDDGKNIIEQKSLFAVIANAPYYGGGFYPTPKAEPFDGKLDYSVISVVSRLKILSLMGAYRKGTHVGLNICKIGTCQKVEIIADRESPINMDGEITYSDKVSFEIIKKGVKLILPKTIFPVWSEKADKVGAKITV